MGLMWLMKQANMGVDVNVVLYVGVMFSLSVLLMGLLYRAKVKKITAWRAFFWSLVGVGFGQAYKKKVGLGVTFLGIQLFGLMYSGTGQNDDMAVSIILIAILGSLIDAFLTESRKGKMRETVLADGSIKREYDVLDQVMDEQDRIFREESAHDSMDMGNDHHHF